MGSAIAVQIMESLQPDINPLLLERNGLEMSENRYYMIMAIVNQGFSGAVMEAARPEGASGGTVFHSRRIASEETMKFWKISVQEEREVVMILARREDKLSIMQAIGQKCGVKSEAQGVVFSLPVDESVGLE
ncbi:MAG: P-II family nitrogen regulator [Acetatifactor sp.]|nr:P-II family nitrogen regulator [Acetatifactor sp.]